MRKNTVISSIARYLLNRCNTLNDNPLFSLLYTALALKGEKMAIKELTH